jgi:hypothetical protein
MFHFLKFQSKTRNYLCSRLRFKNPQGVNYQGYCRLENIGLIQQLKYCSTNEFVTLKAIMPVGNLRVTCYLEILINYF